MFWRSSFGVVYGVIFSIALPVIAGAQLTPKESRSFEEALTVSGLTSKDLAFARSEAPASRLKLTQALTENPISGLETLIGFQTGLTPALSSLLHRALIEGFGDPNTGKISPPTSDWVCPSTLPIVIEEPVREILGAMDLANADIRQALNKLTAEEKRILIESLPQWAAGGEAVTFEFVSKPKTSLKNLDLLLAKVDLGRIRSAAHHLSFAMENAIPKLQQIARTNPMFPEFRGKHKGITFEISGAEPNKHISKDATLSIDFGGQNRYSGRYGAGVGFTSIIIDFGTQSIVEAGDLHSGVGLLGVGYAHFESRGLLARGKSLCFGVGLAGVGLFSSTRATILDAKSIAEGVGFEGVGICLLSKEDDRSRIGFLGQGAGLTNGIGWLYNPAGTDTYFAGGAVTDDRLGESRLAKAQGYASGIEQLDGGKAGGLGILSDAEGDDTYSSGTETQGFGFWSGVGFLCDGSGNDIYRAQGFGQAVGITSGAGFFADLSGNDNYTCQFGPGQAMALDGSTAALLDRSGDDLYVGRDTIPGSSEEASLTLFFDGGGRDRIVSNSPSIPRRTGNENGLAFRVLLGENVSLSETTFVNRVMPFGTESTTTYSPNSMPPSGPSLGSQFVGKPLDGSLYDATFAVASLRDGRASGQAVRDLSASGLPALRHLLSSNLSSLNRSGAATLAAMIVENGAQGRAELITTISKAPESDYPVILRIATEASVRELLPTLPSWIEKSGAFREIPRYISKMESPEASAQFAFLALNPDRIVAREGSRMFGRLAKSTDIVTLSGLLKSNDHLVRTIARNSFQRFAPDGIAIAKTLLQSEREEDNHAGVLLLAAIGTDEAIRYAATGLNHPAPKLRIAALSAVDGRVPSAFRSRVLELQQDSNAMVASVARSISLGRSAS